MWYEDGSWPEIPLGTSGIRHAPNDSRAQLQAQFPTLLRFPQLLRYRDIGVRLHPAPPPTGSLSHPYPKTVFTMTSLDPSHIPNIFSSSRTRGQATISSLPIPSRPSPPQDSQPSPSGSSRTEPLINEEEGSDSDEDEEGGGRGGRRRSLSKVALKPPIPDLRFETGYLVSIKPFIHPSPRLPSATASEHGPVYSEKGKEKEQKREEGMRVAEDLSLAGDTTGRIGELDVTGSLFEGEISVEWGKVAWITLRDQVRSISRCSVRDVDELQADENPFRKKLIFPFLQGSVWGAFGFFSPIVMSWYRKRKGPGGSRWSLGSWKGFTGKLFGTRTKGLA